MTFPKSNKIAIAHVEYRVVALTALTNMFFPKTLGSYDPFYRPTRTTVLDTKKCPSTISHFSVKNLNVAVKKVYFG